MGIEHLIREYTSIVLFISWILMVFSGTVLLLKGLIVLYQYVPLPTNIVVDVHICAGFVMFGSSVMHAYLNRMVIAMYLRKFFKA